MAVGSEFDVGMFFPFIKNDRAFSGISAASQSAFGSLWLHGLPDGGLINHYESFRPFRAAMVVESAGGAGPVCGCCSGRRLADVSW